MKRFLLLAVLATSLTACGAPYQNYHNSLVARQNAFHRQQLILDEENQVTINDFKSKQRQQLIDQKKADAAMTVIEANADAQATIAKAKAEAQANDMIARSLTPLLVQTKWINALGDKSVIYLPSGVLPIANLVK